MEEANISRLAKTLVDGGQFTGKERDTESGNDYFGARYFASSMGRFISPDHPFVDQHPDDPQSWNLYAYARNNPLINIDPTGLGCITDLGQGSDANHEKVEFNNSINSDDCAGQHGTWVPGDVSAENRGQKTGDRKPGTENRGQKTGDRKPGTDGMFPAAAGEKPLRFKE